MFSVQGYKRLDELFTTFRSKRLARAEQELERSDLDGQMPSENDIEEAFLEIVSEALENSFPERGGACSVFRSNSNTVGPSNKYKGYSCSWCDGSHRGIDCEHRGYRPEIAP